MASARWWDPRLLDPTEIERDSRYMEDPRARMDPRTYQRPAEPLFGRQPPPPPPAQTAPPPPPAVPPQQQAAVADQPPPRTLLDLLDLLGNLGNRGAGPASERSGYGPIPGGLGMPARGQSLLLGQMGLDIMQGRPIRGPMGIGVNPYYGSYR